MSDEQARNAKGEFSSGTANGGEAGQRAAKRYVVRPHVQQSVGTHTGKQVLGNVGKALFGAGLGAAGTIVGSALRAQRHGGRR